MKTNELRQRCKRLIMQATVESHCPLINSDEKAEQEKTVVTCTSKCVVRPFPPCKAGVLFDLSHFSVVIGPFLRDCQRADTC